jgi:hypothetical protein
VLWHVVADEVASEQVKVSPASAAGVASQFQVSGPPSPMETPPSAVEGVADTIQPPRSGVLVGWRVSTFDRPRTDQVPNISQPLTLSVKGPPSPQEPDAV